MPKACSRLFSTNQVVTSGHFTTGTMVNYRLGYLKGHDYTWWSQPVVNRAPLGNMLLSGAILFSGPSYTGVSDMAQCLGLLFLSHSSYHENQKTTFFPMIKKHRNWNDVGLVNIRRRCRKFLIKVISIMSDNMTPMCDNCCQCCPFLGPNHLRSVEQNTRLVAYIKRQC